MQRPLVVFSSSVVLGLIVSMLVLVPPEREPRAAPRAQTVVGDPDRVSAAYAEWKEQFRRDPTVEIALRWSKALSRVHTHAQGLARFDLALGRATFEVTPCCEDVDVWLVGGDGRDAKAGRVRASGATSVLELDLAGSPAENMLLDRVVITRADEAPASGAMLVGHPGLFERLYSRERLAAKDADRAVASGMLLGVVAFDWIPPGGGSGGGGGGAQIPELVAAGENLFFNETFEGNGRTCGTCHPAENNFTLDKPFIEHMFQANPNDPLFVAEFDPNLMQNPVTNERFETPELMHSLGLITINPDGFDDLAHKFVLRSVPHTLGMIVSILRPKVSTSVPRQRTGWAGDGAPGSGTLREFAIGAVVQHATRKMSRIEGVDFRLPTPNELDAMEAFQLSLGRQTDPDLFSGLTTFLDSSAEAGRTTFNGNCAFCHLNAGANSSVMIIGGQVVGVGNPPPGIANSNFNTGVEAFLTSHPDGSGIQRPIDGGFGVIPIDPLATPNLPDPEEIVPNADGSFGDKTFNTASLIEFADTAPAFHNNITLSSANVLGTDPVEAAVNFYRSAEFGNSPAGQAFGGPFALSDTDVKNIGRMLRALNAVENARSSSASVRRAIIATALQDQSTASFDPAIDRMLSIAEADAIDGRDVLDAVGLNPVASTRFQTALDGIVQARDATLTWADRKALMVGAKSRLDDVKPKVLGP